MKVGPSHSIALPAVAEQCSVLAADASTTRSTSTASSCTRPTPESSPTAATEAHQLPLDAFVFLLAAGLATVAVYKHRDWAEPVLVGVAVLTVLFLLVGR